MNKELILILRLFVQKEIECSSFRQTWYSLDEIHNQQFCKGVDCNVCLFDLSVLGKFQYSNLILVQTPLALVPTESGSNHESFSSK